MVLSEAQRRLRKSKESERELGRFLLVYNGQDPLWVNIASSTGRVGQITDLQFDVVSNDYASENKNVRVGKNLLAWWDQICMIAAKHGKYPMLRLDPTNEGKHAEMHIISAERHARLLEIERVARQREDDLH